MSRKSRVGKSGAARELKRLPRPRTDAKPRRSSKEVILASSI